MANPQYATPLPKTIFDEYKLRLTAPKPDGQRKAPTLRVAVIKNNPRIDVYTELEGDRDNGRLSAPMDGSTFFALLEMVLQMADSPPDSQCKITNKVGPPQDRKVISTTVIGKDTQGRVYISLTAPDRPRIQFIYLPSDWHVLSHKDGTPYSEAELSVVYARAWVKLMMQLTPAVMAATYTEPEPRGNSGGGKTWQGNNKYKQNAAPVAESFDNDFPM
jgi:hypothetical protein